MEIVCSSDTSCKTSIRGLCRRGVLSSGAQCAAMERRHDEGKTGKTLTRTEHPTEGKKHQCAVLPGRCSRLIIERPARASKLDPPCVSPGHSIRRTLSPRSNVKNSGPPQMPRALLPGLYDWGRPASISAQVFRMLGHTPKHTPSKNVSTDSQ